MIAQLLAMGLLTQLLAAEPAEMQRCMVGSAQGRCGTISVPERPGTDDGRSLELFISVVPATGDGRQPDPIVVLEGGPGASVTHFAGLHVQSLAGALRQRDLVLFDQRGTGRSSALDCDLMDGFRSLPTPASAARCRDILSTSADLEYYTTAEAVADLAAVLDHLGYQRANLFAVSNGTRTALRFLAEHPERVRSVILLAPYPTTRNVLPEAGETLDDSLQDLAAACEVDAQCGEAYPNLRSLLEVLPERYGNDPAWGLFSTGVRMMLFFPLQASRVPQLLDLVHRGGRLPERSRGPQDDLLAGWISQGAFMSVICSEDAARTTVETVRQRTNGTFLGPAWAESLVRSCQEWPRKPLPEGFARPVESDVPALLLVGGLDPAMPPSWAHETADTLSAARVVEIPEGQHSFIGMSGVMCLLTLMNDFLDSGSSDSLDASCAAEMRRPALAPPAR